MCEIALGENAISLDYVRVGTQLICVSGMVNECASESCAGEEGKRDEEVGRTRTLRSFRMEEKISELAKDPHVLFVLVTLKFAKLYRLSRNCNNRIKTCLSINSYLCQKSQKL